MNKYFPVYAAILGIIALLLFLSPQIAKFISADTPTPVELLHNNDFASEALNNQVWIRKASDQANLIKIVSGVLRIENLASTANPNYTLISQKIDLKNDTLYHLKITYDQPIQSPSSASTGIQKNDYSSAYALIFPLEKGTQTSEFYFLTDKSFKNPYFYLYLGGQGNILINSVSLTESSDQSISPSQASSSNTLPIPQMISTPSTTATTKTEASPTITPSASATISAAKSISASTATPVAKSPVAASAGSAIFYPGWSVIGFENNSTTDIFAKNNLDTYQCFGSKWLKSSNSSTIFSSNAGALVYSSNKELKKLTLDKTDSQASAAATIGWNLLYNSSDQDISDTREFLFSDGKTQARSFALKRLVADKNASADVYLVSGDKTGVTLNKISFPEEAIPAKTVFWFYLKKLP